MRTPMSLVALVVVGGCGGSGSGTLDPLAPTQQVEFDLTVRADYERWQLTGLDRVGLAGPYALFEVTNGGPALDGPRVLLERSVGFAMVCGASSYFTSLANAPRIAMHLRSNDSTVVEQFQTPSSDTAMPTDDFGDPFTPPTTSGDGGSAGGGDTCVEGCNNAGGPSGGAGGAGGAGGSDGTSTGTGGSGSGGVIFSTSVRLTPAPPIGSIVALRRVAFAGAREHNGSHVLPALHCAGRVCSAY